MRRALTTPQIGTKHVLPSSTRNLPEYDALMFQDYDPGIFPQHQDAWTLFERSLEGGSQEFVIGSVHMYQPNVIILITGLDPTHAFL